MRSSAVDEDGADAAFAGAGDTHLYVDNTGLLEHVKEVWASLWNPRALLYRQTKGLSLSNLNQAVVIQMMAPSEVSGVAFTQDPVSGNTARLIVNAAFGLGEGIVSGRVAPDQYVVSKKLGREILPAMISDKKLAIVRDVSGKGVAEKRMVPERRRARSLSPKQLELLNTVAVALERHFGYALDLEWGFVGDKLYILQSRPVTKNAEASAPVAAAKPKAKKLLFVCTGNTCRSAMAEYLAKGMVSEGFETSSRGLSAYPGQAMPGPALEALQGYGIDAQGHQAQGLTRQDIEGADVILGMTGGHVVQILERYPQARGKVHTLNGYAETGGGDIGDPYGSDLATYKETAARLEEALGKILKTAPAPAASASPR